jgi:hypothetical protein
MLGDAGVEGVHGEVFLSLQQPEPGFGNDEMQKAGLGTDRAIAVLTNDPLGSLDFEDDRFAVATAAIDHGFPSHEKMPTSRNPRTTLRTYLNDPRPS